MLIRRESTILQGLQTKRLEVDAGTNQRNYLEGQSMILWEQRAFFVDNLLKTTGGGWGEGGW